MNQTEENLRRIRAYDAEGEWRTINGAHVLIQNGKVVGGAGGKFNGQTFGSKLKPMAAGAKGITAQTRLNRLDKSRSHT